VALRHVKVSAPVPELLSQCPFCSEITAVRLGASEGRFIFSCVSCDEEFEIEERD